MNLEQHFQQLNADLINSSSENERDMFDQRNQQYQTIILSCSVMFASLSTVIIQGFLPTNSGTNLFLAYSLVTSISFACLFLSIVLCIEITHRSSRFMYKRANKQTKQLKEAIENSKNMLSQMRQKFFTKEQKRFKITTDVTDSLEAEWMNHENFVHDYLQARDDINTKAAIIDIAGDLSSDRKSFEKFWKESCEQWGRWAIFFFYAGTVFLLASIALYMWAEFALNYDNTSGALIAVCLIGFALVLGFVFWVTFNLFEKNDMDRSIDSSWADGGGLEVSDHLEYGIRDHDAYGRGGVEELEEKDSDVSSPRTPFSCI